MGINFNKLLGKGNKTVDREHKKCIYCGEDVFTSNIGICSRKRCRRMHPRHSEDGMQSYINYNDKMIERKLL